MGELKEPFVRAQEDPDAKLVMITGMGEKAFIAGPDLNELALLNPISGKELVLGGHETETGHSEFPQLPCLLEKSKACMGTGLVGKIFSALLPRFIT